MANKFDTDGNEWQLNAAGDGWEPATGSAAPSNEPDIMSMGLLQNFGQGATLGFGDELSAALSAGATSMLDNSGTAGTFGEEYSASLERLRNQQSEYADAHPGIATAAEIGGGVLTSAAALGPALARGGLKRALAAGVGEGAIYGAGAADTGAGEGRGEGALIGAGFGLGGGAVGAGVGKIVGRVLDRVSEIRAARAGNAGENLTGSAGVSAPGITEDTATGLGELTQGLSVDKRATEAMAEGYDLSPWQKFGGERLGLKEEAYRRRAGGSPWLESKRIKNQRLFNQKVGETIGLKNATDLGEENMATAVDQITQQMGKLTMRGGVSRQFKIAPSYIKRIEGIEDNYIKSYDASNRVSNILQNMREDFASGKITASRLQEAHSDAGQNMINADRGPDQRAYAAMREVMDDLMEANMGADAKPLWKKLRGQWGNLQMILRPGVITKEGHGDVSARVLANKLRQANPLGFVTGKPDVRMAEISRVAKLGVKATQRSGPTSGTTEGLVGVNALMNPGRGLLNGIVADAQEIPYRAAPQLISQPARGTAGLLGGFNAAQHTEHEGNP